MNNYIIKGGKPVTGKIKALGAKNFVTKAMVASLLADGESQLFNVPHIGDVDITAEMISSTGAKIFFQEDTLVINSSAIHTHKVTLPQSGTNRIPILMITPLLHKYGKAEVPILGGCNIGLRKVDFHINALIKFGATIKENEGGFTAYADNLKGCTIELDYPSVGATETCLLLGSVASGTSVIKNAALEPEIQNLILFLKAMGANIYSSSSRDIIIEGNKNLHPASINVIGDRIDVASWACLACATNGEIVVENIEPYLINNFLSYFQIVGGGFKIYRDNSIKFYRSGPLRSTVLETDVFPGFSTDWQQPFAILLSQAEGVSIIHETVYENRFGYLSDLNVLGLKSQLSQNCLGSLPCRYKNQNHKHSAIIQGPSKLYSDNLFINVPDLRAGLAYIIASAVADGVTTIGNHKLIERGYGNLIERCKNLSMDFYFSKSK